MEPTWPTFSPGDTMSAFCFALEQEATSYGFPPSKWSVKLLVLLNGQARTVGANCLQRRPSASYDELKQHLVDVIDKTAEEAARSELRGTGRRDGETPRQYAVRLRTSAYCLYGRDNERMGAWIENEVLEIFLANLGGVLGERVRSQFPDTLDRAVNFAQEWRRQMEMEGTAEAASRRG